MGYLKTIATMKYAYITYDTYSHTTVKHCPIYPKPIILIYKNRIQSKKDEYLHFVYD